jgi:pyrimidine operon attenuation protein/uracil phosphoribosyltransferase
MAETAIMSSQHVARTVRRLAYEVVEHNQGAEALDVFGILDSGSPLAQALVAEINAIEESTLQAHDLDVTTYRDDYEGAPARSEQGGASLDITDRHVLLVDDVLFTGRTARAALDAVLQYGRPRSIQLAVLIDRGHREYPIHPDYVGRHLPTKHRERVVVRTKEDFTVSVVDAH